MNRKPHHVPDHELWDEVKASIVPIKKAKRVKPGKAPVLQRGLAASPSRPVPAYPAEPQAHRPLRPARTTPPPLASFDRRTAQKLGRGQSDPESRLDLHGENLENARHALLHFLSSRRMQGQRLVLVITGKGASPFSGHTLHGHTHFHVPERAGKLRREVPLWLEEAQFRIHVVGYQPAHPRHGGGGAFYVRLRKHAGEHP